MELLALSLALLSGVGHAVWNFLIKRAIDKQVFLWWMLFLRTLVLVPLVAIWAQGISIPLVSLLCATGSAVFYATCVALMGKAYLSPIRSLNTRPSQLALLAAVLASSGACIRWALALSGLSLMSSCFSS